MNNGESGNADVEASARPKQSAAKDSQDMPSAKRTPLDRFFSKVRKTDSCWLWLGASDPEGCGYFWDRKNWRAHRYSFVTFRGEIPSTLVICHHCDNPPCVNPDHLFVGTHTDNMRDKARKGRHNSPRGLSHWFAAVNQVEADWIRELVRRGLTYSQIGMETGASAATISRLVHGKHHKGIR